LIFQQPIQYSCRRNGKKSEDKLIEKPVGSAVESVILDSLSKQR
jgi:hypothetical protein